MSAATEPASVRWKRRATTIPTMLGVTVAALVALPVVVPILIGVDLLRGRRHLPALRVYLFLTQYACNDSAEILLAPVYWLLAGAGTRLHSAASIDRHERLQRWSIVLLARRARQLLGIRLEIDDTAAAAFEPAPAIVMCRHVNLFDASLPALLYEGTGYHVRSVIMAELLADPGFDLLYGRLGSVFVPRDNGPRARDAIGKLGATLDRSTIAVIFPEGRLYRPELLSHIQAKLTHSDAGRAKYVAGLRHVLPVRPGGVSALLESAPDADVVVVAHVGLDDYPDFRTLARHVPLAKPIQVAAWRIARSQIPADPDARLRWLDETWQDVDDWVDMHRIR
jgi:1-acyl-sn-glycerol-3-phosphate acyltransferase